MARIDYSVIYAKTKMIMVRKFFVVLIVPFIMIGCYDQGDFAPTELEDVIRLQIENDDAPADGETRIRLLAIFPSDFNTESDNMVDFNIIRAETSKESAPIRLVSLNGENQKIAEIFITNLRPKKILVRATILTSGSEISKETEVSFIEARGENIFLRSNSLTINTEVPFSELNLTTELKRSAGRVSLGQEASLVALDTLGNSRGIFRNFNKQTDSAGTINNTFTLGPDSYRGRLLFVAEALNKEGVMLTDSIKIFPQ